MKGKWDEKQIDSHESASGRIVILVLCRWLSVATRAHPGPEAGRCARQVLRKHQRFLGGELMV
jgi:hypothetical protein